MRWQLDDGPWERADVYQIVMANGKCYGGGMVIAPEASITDGLFDVFIFKDVGVLDITLLPKIYRGTHVDYDKIESTRASKVRVELAEDATADAEPVLIEADGEIIGTLPATWTLLPKQISLLYPQTTLLNETRGTESKQAKPGFTDSFPELQD